MHPVRRRRRKVRAARLAVLAGVLLCVGAAVALVARRGDGDVPVVPTPPPQRHEGEFEPVPDPFAWDEDREDDFVRRAARGTSHALYVRSPGGAVASAARTTRWRPLVESAARQARVDPDLLEGLVFLESAGRPDALTAGGTEGAAGLTQILAETGRNLLGLRVEVARSRRYTRRIERERRRGREERVRRLEAARRRVDERFDPAEALQATARYLTFARERLGGREDLALVSYHMGVGNLQGVLRAFGGELDGDRSYAEVYFDSTPRRHVRAYRRLAAFGDDSSNYLWKVHAGREIMRLHRRDPAALARLSALHTAKSSAEEVLHPPERTERFGDPRALRAAWDAGRIRVLPDDPVLTGLAGDPRMGELAERLDVPRGLYRGLRPEALALLLYVGAQVRELSGEAPLIVTSTVRDDAYQRLLVRRNREATRNFSLHTTGWAFDVSRTYRSQRQALAFQFVLDRLQVLDVIAWAREPSAIHVTAGPDARALLPLLDRVEP
jgi:hypothetical protein